MKHPLLRFCGSWILASLLGCAMNQALAQGTLADYERAAGLQKQFANKVSKATLQANWLTGNTQFWYRNDLAGGGREYILVYAIAGSRAPAFDHQKVAAALTRLTGQTFNPTNLPFERLEWEGTNGPLTLRGPRQSWRYDPRTGELTAASGRAGTFSSAKRLDVPRATRQTGAETQITFNNQSTNAVDLFWIDTSNERHPYGTIEAGASRDQHTFAGHVWLAATRSGQTLAVFEATEADSIATITNEPQLENTSRRSSRRSAADHPADFTSPDGKFQAFFKEHNLHIRNLDDKSDCPLSADGSATNSYSGQILWSPDSKKIVALRTRAGESRKVYYIESSPKDQLQPKLHSYDYPKPGDVLPQSEPQLFDIASARRVPVANTLFSNSWSVSDLRWEPDSSAFTFLFNQRGHQVMRVISVSAADGEARAIVEERCPTFFCYSSKLFLRHLPATKELIWMSERDGWNHLYLYDAETGRVKNQITKGEWVVRGVERVDEQNRQLWLSVSGIKPSQDPYHIHFCRVNFDGTGLTLLTEGDGTHSIEYSPDRRFYVDTWSRVDQPPVHELRRASDGGLIRELDRADASALIKAGWRAPERFAAKGRDGTTDIYGIIIRPTNFNPRKKYPVIEDIYAGPHDSFVPKSFRAHYRMQELAELGFIIVKMDGMGTSNRSKKFHDECWKNVAEAGFPDRIAWIKAAASKHPEMDLKRVGIYGGSAGGQSSTHAVLVHGDFYKAAVSDCGCHDNRMDKIWWNEQWMGWPIGPHYAEQSNVTQAHRLTGKLMLVVGEKDENVDPASTLQVADALIKADKDFDLLVIPGAGHGAAESKYGSRRRADFFVRHLLGVEPRAKQGR